MRYKLFKFYLLFIAIAWSAFSCSSHKRIRKSSDIQSPDKFISEEIEKKYAALLNVETEKITNARLYSFIDEWYDVPYKYGGHTKKGIDCSNFASILYNVVYHKSLTGSSSSICKQCKTVLKINLTEGDLVFFKIDKDDVSHVGVYLQNNKFVHATTKKGVIIDDLNEPYYKKYYFTSGRLNESTLKKSL